MLVIWQPSPNRNLRDPRYAIRAVVNHRIVGTLASARSRFLNPNGGASSHFGIGTEAGRLTIEQYVDLADMAWTNGDVREPTWSRIIPGVNPNLYTVTIEHEDGGAANRGRVSEDVWRASMELQKLLVSGDKVAIRAAGIRVRHDHIVDQLAAVPKDGLGFIDHHQIAGPNKPYCFRRWLDDPGFVEGSPSRRDRLLALLNGDDDMQYWKPVQEDFTTINGTRFWDGEGTLKQFTNVERVTSVAESSDDKFRLIRYGNELLVALRASMNVVKDTRVPGFPPTTGYTQAQLDTAAKAARVDMHTKAVAESEAHTLRVKALK